MSRKVYLAGWVDPAATIPTHPRRLLQGMDPSQIALPVPNALQRCSIMFLKPRHFPTVGEGKSTTHPDRICILRAPLRRES